MTTVLICGSRSINNYGIVKEAIEQSPLNIDKIIHGGAKGVDVTADIWAKLHDVEVECFYVDDEDDRYSYEEDGRGAPLERNKVMVEKADAVIAVWDGKSSGTKQTMKHAEKQGMNIVKTNKTSGEAQLYYLKEDE